MNLHTDVVKAFIRTVRQIGAASDLRDLRVVKGRRLEKLKGDREGQYSMRLNDQYRLILAISNDAQGHIIIILNIVDYH